MHVILPLFSAVLSVDLGSFACSLDKVLVHIHEVEVPDTSHENFEKSVMVESSAHESMVVLEFFKHH